MSQATYTANRIKSDNALILACTGLSALADLVVCILLLAGGFSFLYLIFPLLLLLADLVFAVSAAFTNFRFRYAKKHIAFYALTVIVCATLTLFVDLGSGVFVSMGAAPGGKIVATAAVSALWIVLHVFACVSVVVSYYFAAKVKRPFKGFGALAVAGILAVVTLTYAVVILQNGFFGQGGERVLQYAYDAVTDGYVVTGVLDGKGDTVVLSDTFDGKKVTKLDCDVFLAKGVKNVYVRVPSDIELQNVEQLAKVSSALNLFSQKDEINAFKNRFHAMAKSMQIEQIHGFADNFYPELADENEIYVSFDYESWAYEHFDDNLLYVWFGQKGQAFDFSAYEEEYPYLARWEPTDDNFNWSEQHNDGYQMKKIATSDGLQMGVTLNESVKNVDVTFEKIYHVVVGNDNDELFEYQGPKSTVIGGETRQYRYATVSTAEALLSELNQAVRAGFGLGWKNVAGEPVERLADAFGSDKTVTVTPEWSMKLPSVSVSSSLPSNRAVYGSPVTLTASAQFDGPTPVYAYQWKREGVAVGDGKGVCYMEHPTPSESGRYEVTVTASYPTESSLTSASTAGVAVVIDKKPLSFEWSHAQDLTYNGEDYPITCKATDGQAVGGDVLGFTHTYPTVRGAGTFVSNVKLDAATAAKYSVDGNTSSYVITVKKRPITVTWQIESYVYDGQKHQPVITAVSNAVDDLDNAFTYAIAEQTAEGKSLGIDAGSYIVTATIANSNYEFQNQSNRSQVYAITQRELALTDSNWSNLSLVYNGREQKPTVTAKGVGNADIQINVSGGQTNCGEYTATAGFVKTADDRNYRLTGATKTFVITPMTVEVVWSNTTLVYTGKSQAPAAAAKGAGDVSLKMAVSGEKTNAGAGYEAIASLAEALDIQNYELTNETVTFAIGKLSVSPVWSNTSLVYDGNQQLPTVRVTGVDGDIIVSVTGQAVDAGTYVAAVELSDPNDRNNYELTGATSSGYSIAKRKLTPVWGSTSFVYNAQEQAPVATAQGVRGEALNLTVSGAQTNAGSYKATVSFADEKDRKNYDWTDAQIDFVIAKRDLTVTFENVTKTYDKQTIASFIYAVEGLQGSEQFEDLFAESRNEASDKVNVGEYEIKCAFAAKSMGANYNLKVVSGKLVIQAVKLTLTWENGVATFDESQIMEGDVVTVTYAYSQGGTPLAQKPTAAGSYEVKATSANANYTFENAVSTLVIEQPQA